MTTIAKDHIAEEQLIAHSLGELNDDVVQHIGTCERCAHYVQDIEQLKIKLKTMGNDDEVPAHLAKQILAVAHSKKRPDNQFDFISNWYKNPFVLGLIVAGLTVIVYVIVVYAG